MFFFCFFLSSSFVQTQHWWSAYTLSTARKHREERAATCRGPWVVMQTQHALSCVTWIHRSCHCASQCGGFSVPSPRCCFCFCCISSCSSAEGPGCIIELDQIDLKLSMSSVDESSSVVSGAAHVLFGVLT